MGPRHLLVHLGYNHGGIFRRTLDNINRYAEAYFAARIRRRYLNQGHIERQLSGFEDPGDIRQQHGGVISEPFLDMTANVLADEETVHHKTVSKVAARIGGVALGQQLKNLDIRQHFSPRGHGIDQLYGFGATAPDEDPLPRLYI